MSVIGIANMTGLFELRYGVIRAIPVRRVHRRTLAAA
jgi:hypothetical protein